MGDENILPLSHSPTHARGDLNQVGEERRAARHICQTSGREPIYPRLRVVLGPPQPLACHDARQDRVHHPCM